MHTECLSALEQSLFIMWGVAVVSILNLEKKGSKRIYPVLATKEGGENLREQEGV